MDCSPPGFSIHGIFQARVLEWVSIYIFMPKSSPDHMTDRVRHKITPPTQCATVCLSDPMEFSLDVGFKDFACGPDGKESACQCRRPRLDPLENGVALKYKLVLLPTLQPLPFY